MAVEMAAKIASVNGAFKRQHFCFSRRLTQEELIILIQNFW
jgi:hypothetical protein